VRYLNNNLFLNKDTTMMRKKIKHLDLWIEYQQEEDPVKKHKLKNKLVEIYYPLVKTIAYKLAKKIEWKLSVDELRSFGVDGLYISIRRFDLDKGASFSTYASRRIYGSMIDCMRKEDIIPRSVRINHNKIEKMRVIMESEKGEKVLDNEILEELEINCNEYNANRKKFHPISFTSIEGSTIPKNSFQDEYHQDFNSGLEDGNNSSPDSVIVRKEFFNKLVGNNFTIVEQKIIYYYYYKNLTMDRISEKLKMSESRISQIHKNVLPRLKEKINRNPKYFGKDIYEIIKNCNDKNDVL